MRWGAAIVVAGAALAQAAAVRAQMPPDASALKAIEARIEQQVWYPAGYYDIRIAAEAQAAEAPRTRKAMISRCSGSDCYNVIDCRAEAVPFNPADMAVSRYGRTALEVSRLQNELARIGYRKTVYAQPLIDFERQMIALDTWPNDAELKLRADSGSSAGMKAALGEANARSGDEPYRAMAAAIEANRLRLAPRTPRVVATGGCGKPWDGPITVRTVPAGGEILLINAFAFKVCTRRLPDPWDRFACKWNEWEAGVMRTKPYGRFVYQVKWPDGVVRKGTRLVQPDPGQGSVMVTFSKVGS